ncbi:GGDEF domain-containing protein [Actinoplanes sp. NPDC089786]|uniref:GGDEF domain-containing protein n=1 Tax=Actinoplanes sp. NPDC089786 TaxID=3155185 RepID=UPI0034246E57
MSEWIEPPDRFPVPVTAYGPLHLLARRAYELATGGHTPEAIRAAEAYLTIAEAVDDQRTIAFLQQAKMYAFLYGGRIDDATAVGELLLATHRRTGNVVAEAKVLCDLAQMRVLQTRYVDGMRYLARAGMLLDLCPRSERHRSAMCSFAHAAAVAQMYETAADAYERLTAQDGDSSRTTTFDLVYSRTLLYWGVRLDHVGRFDEAATRLRRTAAITRRWLDQHPGDPCMTAVQALALAKLGDTAVAEKLAESAIMPLREGESWEFARMAHLALGISRRASGRLSESRREFLAAHQLCDFSAPHPDERPIIRYEMGLTAVALDGGQPSRDLFAAVANQVRELWQLRLQRVGMLRQARQREEVEAARADAEQESRRDALTGLGNRRRFDLLLGQVDAGELGRPLTLLLVDLDHFKAVNDAYSHSAGDRVLREVATLLVSHCRPGDEAVRYAGDEFVLFLRGDAAHGRDVAERIRQSVARAEILAGVRLTVSVGMAELTDGMTAEALFRAVDDRLYAAKWSGRNTIAA